jgi:hypothetical protein
MHRNLFAAGLMLSFIAGCGRSDQKLQQAAKSADSWDATLALVQRQWTADQVPALYVRQLSESAAKSLEESRQTVNDLKVDPSRRHALAQRIIQLRDRAQQLRDAAGARGRSS